METTAQLKRITPLQEELLHVLGEFGYVTARQATRIVNRSRSVTVVQRSLRELARYSSLVGVAKQNRISAQCFAYFLLPEGANVLSERTGKPRSSIAHRVNENLLFSLDADHRRMLVDFHINLRQGLQTKPVLTRSGERFLQIDHIDRYFERDVKKNKKTGTNRFFTRTKVVLTSGASLIPDANVILVDTTDPSKRMLFCLEITRGSRNASRVVDQLNLHLQAQLEGLLPDKYGIPSRYRVLMVFERPTLMKTVLARFAKTPALDELDPLFLFSTAEEVERDVINSWCSSREPEKRRNFITGQITTPA